MYISEKGECKVKTHNLWLFYHYIEWNQTCIQVKKHSFDNYNVVLSAQKGNIWELAFRLVCTSAYSWIIVHSIRTQMKTKWKLSWFIIYEYILTLLSNLFLTCILKVTYPLLNGLVKKQQMFRIICVFMQIYTNVCMVYIFFPMWTKSSLSWYQNL